MRNKSWTNRSKAFVRFLDFILFITKRNEMETYERLVDDFPNQCLSALNSLKCSMFNRKKKSSMKNDLFFFLLFIVSRDHQESKIFVLCSFDHRDIAGRIVAEIEKHLWTTLNFHWNRCQHQDKPQWKSNNFYDRTNFFFFDLLWNQNRFERRLIFLLNLPNVENERVLKLKTSKEKFTEKKRIESTFTVSSSVNESQTFVFEIELIELREWNIEKFVKIYENSYRFLFSFDRSQAFSENGV